MRLIIRRDQAAKKGVFGGHKGMKFSLSCRVELSEDEKNLVKQYKVGDHVLTWQEHGGPRGAGLTIQSLINGINNEVDDVATLLSNEEVIKKACGDFKVLLEVMATFGGDEVVEY